LAVIQIIGDQPGSGKTSLAGALLLHRSETGQSTGYCKPLSDAPDKDSDASFVSEMLLSGSNGPPVPTPHRLPSNTGSALDTSLAGQIKSDVTQLEAAAGLVLLECPDLAQAGGGASTLPLELASLVDARVVLLFRYTHELDAGAILTASRPFGDRLAGIVVNGVTAYRGRDINQTLAAEARAGGVPFLGALPEDRAILAVTVQQIADFLGGRWVQEAGQTDASIERFLIGGNIMDLGQTYFGRHSNQAVITRAARPDIQMASMLAGTRCLVLTGGTEPTEYVKAEALQREVPLLLVEGTTLDTAEALAGLLQQANTHSMQKIQRFLHLMREHLDLDALTPAA
jgi:BioD-like phosphotransacetylase family protein